MSVAVEHRTVRARANTAAPEPAHPPGRSTATVRPAASDCI